VRTILVRPRATLAERRRPISTAKPVAPRNAAATDRTSQSDAGDKESYPNTPLPWARIRKDGGDGTLAFAAKLSRRTILRSLNTIDAAGPSQHHPDEIVKIVALAPTGRS
jgi:hypothetical protein